MSIVIGAVGYISFALVISQHKAPYAPLAFPIMFIIVAFPNCRETIFVDLNVPIFALFALPMVVVIFTVGDSGVAFIVI